jgi:hypothetical protein
MCYSIFEKSDVKGKMKMGSRVVTIQRPNEDFRGKMHVPLEIQVVFTWSRPKLCKRGYQTVTTCVLRHGLKQIGIGVSIENLNDERDDSVGCRWAYKRAVESMMKRIDYLWKEKITLKQKKQIESLFRKALWEATK